MSKTTNIISNVIFIGDDKNVGIYDELKTKFPEMVFTDDISTIPNGECDLMLNLTDKPCKTWKNAIDKKIPIISNNTIKTIKWNTIDDIEQSIKKCNIDKFSAHLSKYKNILFVSTDYPTYGGAATNCYNLVKYYELLGHKTYGIFVYDDQMTPYVDNFNDTNIAIVSTLKELHPKIKQMRKISGKINVPLANVLEGYIKKIKEYFNNRIDLVIIRNVFDVAILKKFFRCEYYFLIPGLFSSRLDKQIEKLKTKKDYDEYLHPMLLNTIRQCDKIFVNGFVTKHILEKYYGVLSNVVYYNDLSISLKADTPKIFKSLENRKYLIGAIISDFNRKIKNSGDIIKLFEKFPNDNKIVIGKDSSMLSHIPNTTCVGLIDHGKITKFLENIKIVVNTSFYEGNSNVLVEAQHSGCKIIKYKYFEKQYDYDVDGLDEMISVITNIKNDISYKPLNGNKAIENTPLGIKIVFVDYLSLYTKLTFVEDAVYVVCRKSTVFFNDFMGIVESMDKKLFESYTSLVFFVSGETDKEIVICYRPSVYGEISIVDILKKYYIVNENIVGYVENPPNDLHISSMYSLLGKCKMNLKYFGLSDTNYIDFVMNGNTNMIKYNRTKLFRVFCYVNHSSNNLGLNFDLFCGKYNTHEVFHTEKCLIVSKSIVGYGGNQKTARQLINLLDTEYDVHILSLVISKNTNFDYRVDEICSSIHNSQVVKIKKKKDIIKHINSSSYKFIINNKLNEFFSVLTELSPSIKNYVITHNSMDPFNELIIKNQKYLHKIFTINNAHKELIQNFIWNKSVQTYKYTNYIDIGDSVGDRTKFTKRIAFVGRLSKEKNILLLIEAFKKVVDYIVDVELVIIGDDPKNDVIQKSKFYVRNGKITYLGRLDNGEILKTLKTCDYLVVPSCTEGIPFVIMEAMSIGIPCIYSNINGADEIIINRDTELYKKNGFLFDLFGYEQVKDNINTWDVFDVTEKYFNENTNNLANCIFGAYGMTIKEWNSMSKNCIKFMIDNYSKSVADSKNLLAISEKYNELTNCQVLLKC